MDIDLNQEIEDEYQLRYTPIQQRHQPKDERQATDRNTI